MSWPFEAKCVYFIFYCIWCYVINIAWKLVEDNVYVKPTEGPSNGHHHDKDEKKTEEEKEATTSDGNYTI